MDWRFSTFLLTLFGLLIAFTWATSDAGLCSSAYVKGVLADHTKDGAFNCLDFWLNRYQTLIGALVAIGAAAFAWRGVVMQVASAEAQVRVGRRQSAIALIDALNNKADDVGGLAHQVMFVHHRDRDAQHYRKVAISSLVKMISSYDDAKIVSDEYRTKFEIAMKGHGTCLAAMQRGLVKIDELVSRSLVSSETRDQIWQYTAAARHGLWTHEAAAEYILSVPSVFDEMTTQAKLLKFSNIFDGLSEISFFPPLDKHPGYEAAIRASKNFSELLDSALQDAEGRLP